MTKIKLEKEGKLINLVSVSSFSFIVSFMIFIVSMLFVPLPDFTKDPPVIQQLFMTLGQISTTLLIVGCIAYAIKQAEEKKTMSSVGFSLMAIAQGILLVLYQISFDGEEKIAEAFRTFSAGLYLLIVSILLIAFFGEFPKWLKIVGVISCLPFIVENIMFSSDGKISDNLLYIDTAGNFLFNFTVACWGVFILLKQKNEINDPNNLEVRDKTNA